MNYVTLYGKKDFADAIKLQTLRWEGNPRPNITHKSERWQCQKICCPVPNPKMEESTCKNQRGASKS